ncbi:MAG: PorT family protein, partial [Bacteroidia bacterium]|nr:PorT family protein [Bacteroidia bacterium]
MKNLKNKIMCVSVSALLLVPALKADAQKGELGLRFMPTFSSFEMKTSSGGTVSGGITLGYGFGAFGAFNFSEHVGIQLEAQYIAVSQKYKEVDVERQINLRYFNIPLLLSLNTGKTKPINLNLVVGPQLGLSVGSDIHVSGGGEGSETTKAILSVKTSDVGFAYGAGLDFGLNPSQTFRLGLGFRGVYGLFDISDNSQT